MANDFPVKIFSSHVLVHTADCIIKLCATASCFLPVDRSDTMPVSMIFIFTNIIYEHAVLPVIEILRACLMSLMYLL